MIKTIFLFFTPITLFLIVGCSPIINKYKVSIDAIKASDLRIIPKKYTLKALGENTDKESLDFQEQLLFLEQLLQKQGYQKVENQTLAQQIIFFDYGIEQLIISNEPEVSIELYRSYKNRYAYYNRYATLLAKAPSGKELWRIDLSSKGSSKNLKKIVPLLLEASIPYVGKNTEKAVKVVIKEKKSKKK